MLRWGRWLNACGKVQVIHVFTEKQYQVTLTVIITFYSVKKNMKKTLTASEVISPQAACEVKGRVQIPPSYAVRRIYW